MQVIFRLFCALLFMSAQVQSIGAQSIALTHGEALVASFRQERHLTGFGSAIKSNGQVYLFPQKGVIWSTLAPFENQLIVGARKISQIVNGKVTLRIPASEMSEAKSLGAIFAATLVGDWDLLKRDFGMTKIQIGKKWTVSHDGSAFKVILTGKQFVQTALIERANGDRDKIFFSKHSVQAVSELRDVTGLFK